MERITEEWLRSVGFRWHQLERQPDKHWLLWLGSCIEANTIGMEDLGLELAPAWWKNRNGEDVGKVGRWHCWLRADTGSLYGRFIHVRYLRTQDELIALVEALTGQRWDPANNHFGSMLRPEHAERLRLEERTRLDRQMLRERPKWRDIEKDEGRGGALPEHLEAHARAEEPQE